MVSPPRSFALVQMVHGGPTPVARPIPLPTRGHGLCDAISWGLNWLADPSERRRLVVEFSPIIGRRKGWRMVARLYLRRTVLREVVLDRAQTIGAGLTHLANTWDAMTYDAPVSEGVRNSLRELAGVVTEPGTAGRRGA